MDFKTVPIGTSTCINKTEKKYIAANKDKIYQKTMKAINEGHE